MYPSVNNFIPPWKSVILLRQETFSGPEKQTNINHSEPVITQSRPQTGNIPSHVLAPSTTMAEGKRSSALGSTSSLASLFSPSDSQSLYSYNVQLDSRRLRTDSTASIDSFSSLLPKDNGDSFLMSSASNSHLYHNNWYSSEAPTLCDGIDLTSMSTSFANNPMSNGNGAFSLTSIRKSSHRKLSETDPFAQSTLVSPLRLDDFEMTLPPFTKSRKNSETYKDVLNNLCATNPSAVILESNQQYQKQTPTSNASDSVSQPPEGEDGSVFMEDPNKAKEPSRKKPKVTAISKPIKEEQDEELDTRDDKQNVTFTDGALPSSSPPSISRQRDKSQSSSRTPAIRRLGSTQPNISSHHPKENSTKTSPSSSRTPRVRQSGRKRRGSDSSVDSSSTWKHKHVEVFESDSSGNIKGKELTPDEEHRLREQLKFEEEKLGNLGPRPEHMSPQEHKRVRNRQASCVSRLRKKLFIWDLQKRFMATKHILEKKDQQIQQLNTQVEELQRQLKKVQQARLKKPINDDLGIFRK
eukprot:gene5326-7098_t